MDKILIQNYRGWDIFFDTYTDQFVCRMSDKDNQSDAEKESKSITAIRKYIDEYLKVNQKFEKVDIVKVRNSIEPYYDVYTIIGLRKDGGFTIQDQDGGISKLSKYDENKVELLTEKHIMYNDVYKVWNQRSKEFHDTKRNSLSELRKELGLSNPEKSSFIKQLREKYNWK